MKKILLIHGANLNRLGQRQPHLYGSMTLVELEKYVEEMARDFQLEVICFQSNHEGALIDFIQDHANDSVGVIINPGAFTHYSYALHDALVDAGQPVVEVHLSDIEKREEWRRHSVIAPACIAAISGKKELGYKDALSRLLEKLSLC